jgi:hypothetical protein
MQTKILMSLSALLMAVAGMGASFAPQEILNYAGAWGETFEIALMQIIGALYLSFAMLNWFARAALIGGIYSRPVAIANFMHFGVVAVTLVKIIVAGHHSAEVVGAGVAYVLFAFWFGLILFSRPIKPE